MRKWMGIILSVLLVLTFSIPALAEGQAGTTLTSGVTATSTWERTFGWSIGKSVAPSSWDLFVGDSGTSQYTVTLAKDGGTDQAYMSGEVTVNNGGAVATENLQIILDLFKTGGKNPPVLNTTTVNVSANPVLDPGETGVYPYIITIPSPVTGADYKVTAHITIINHSGYLGQLFGPDPSMTSVYPSGPNKLVNDTVNVTDTNGASWSFGNSGSVQYDKTFDAAGTYNNTATITETGQSASASVIVNVYSLGITKTAQTEFTRTYNWTIDKSADQSSLLLTLGQSFPVNYAVKVASNYTDSAFATNGTITINNPAPIPAVINSVQDIPVGITGTVKLDELSYPYTLAPNSQVVLNYSITELPGAQSFENSAVATLQNYAYGPSGANPTGTHAFSGATAVSFRNAQINEVDETITVADTLAGALGTVTQPGPRTFNYTREIGPYSAYGTYQVDNTATFVANDTQTTGSDNWIVTVSVPQTGGTLTQGYWKTHSKYGPARYDDTWAKIGEDTIFFLSSKSYYQVLWTPPAGDAYYQLAHQYIATKLNILNGTSAPSEVTAAVAQAETLFRTYKPGDIGKNQTLKKKFTELASLLDKYNSGIIGPGHASE